MGIAYFLLLVYSVDTYLGRYLLLFTIEFRMFTIEFKEYRGYLVLCISEIPMEERSL